MRPSETTSAPEQEFPYGWRYVKRTGPDGREELEQVALTLEDVLHPQEGDVIPESKPHEADRRYLTDVLETIPLSPPFTLVTSDLIVRWGVEDMRDHAPDVAVFTGLKRDPEGIEGSIDLSVYGGKCELIIELVSPSTRDNDVVKKKEHYHRLGVPLYIIFDQHVEGGPRFLRPYRHKPHGYVEIETDYRERVDVPLLGLMIGLRDNRVICYDLRSEEVLGNYAGVVRERQEDRKKLEAADLRAEEQAEVIEEQQETIRAEAKARQEAERKADDARQLAERQREEAERAQKEADHQRQEAERAQRQVDEQRQEADRLREEAERAQREADNRALDLEKERRAREEAEKEKRLTQEKDAQRIRDLEEMVRQLQGTSAGGAAG